MANEVQVQDVLPVRSRISWGAILGGVMTAAAVYFLLTFLGIAIGATILYRTGDSDLGIGSAAIWAIISLMLALFSGGCVASQCSVGETKKEAVIYGVVLWGTMFSLLIGLAATRFNVGFGDVMGVASTGTPVGMSDTDRLLRDQGFSADRLLRDEGYNENAIRDLRRDYPGAFQAPTTQGTVQTIAQDPRTVSAAWWTFGGILLSMLAAISGALTGAGPNFTLAAFGFRSAWVSHHRAGQARTAV